MRRESSFRVAFGLSLSIGLDWRAIGGSALLHGVMVKQICATIRNFAISIRPVERPIRTPENRHMDFRFFGDIEFDDAPQR